MVEPTQRARLGLEATTLSPGQTLAARVENYGTSTTGFGADYSIERRDGSTWTEAPESPRGPWPGLLYIAGPGQTAPCHRFPVPATMPAGEYRIVKQVGLVSFSAEASPQREEPIILSANFEVTPG